jgi:hypothetical protein
LVYNAYLKGDKTYLEKICSEVALASFAAEFKLRETEVIFLFN